MATKRIGELQLRSDFDATCSVPVDDTLQSWRVTGQQIRNLIAPLTTIGDLLFATTAGAAQRLAIGSVGQILKPVAGVPAWAWPYSVQRTATTTDAINATTDHVILFNASGGAFTATLPTAASVAGKTYILKKIGTDVNLVTIATTSSQTIDGVTTTTLATPNEAIHVTSDGSNWYVLERIIPEAWVAYTPTFTNFAAASNVSFFSRRKGDSLQVRGRVTIGSPGTAAEARITLGFNGTNSNVTSHATKIGANPELAGVGVISIGAAATYNPLMERSVGYLTLGVQNAGGGGLSKQLGTSLAGGDWSFFAEVPITGWSA